MRIIIKATSISKKELHLYTYKNDLIHILSKDETRTACGKIQLKPNQIDKMIIKEVENAEWCNFCLSNCNVKLRKVKIMR